jgi:hypothetical protein
MGKFLMIVAGSMLVAACSAETETDSETSNELRRKETESVGVDCRSVCMPTGGGLIGSISGERVVSLDFTQLCNNPRVPAPGFHELRAEAPCFLGRMPSRGQALDGASSCEEFDCAETGTLRASACVAPVLRAPVDYRTAPPGGRCATREVACAAAREVYAARNAGELCR